MSSSEAQIDENLYVPAEDSEWRKQVDGLLQYLAAEAASLMRSVPPRGREAFENIADRAPVIFGKFRDWEQLHQSRLDEINRCRDQWRSALSGRTADLGDLDRRVQCRQAELDKIGREVAILAHQRMDAWDKLEANKATLAQHEEHVKQEKLCLDARQGELDTQKADLARVKETLDRDQQTLADVQAKTRKAVEKNSEWSTKITKRFDFLANAQALKDREMAESASKLEQSKKENALLAKNKKELEGRVATQDQEATSLRSTVARLEGTVQDQNTSLSTLDGIVAKVREQDAGFRRLDDENKSLRDVVDRSSGEAQSSKQELAVAQATVESLQSDIDHLRKSEAELQAEVDDCKSTHSDIDNVRRRALELQQEVGSLRPCKIDFETAKRIQESSNTKIRDLEKERDSLQQIHTEIRRERDELRQERDELRQERDELRQERAELRRECDDLQRDCNEVRQERDSLQRDCNEALQERDTAVESIRTLKSKANKFVEDHNTQKATADETILMLRRQRQDVEKERDKLITDKNTLTAMRDDLRVRETDLLQEQFHLRGSLTNTQADLQRSTAQLRSCHCSGRRSSLKRSHDQVDSESEELLSTDESQLPTRKQGKAPESTISVNDVGRSSGRKGVEDSVSPERTE